MLPLPITLFKPAVGSVPVSVRVLGTGGGNGLAVSSSFLPGANKLLLAGGAYRRAGSAIFLDIATVNDSLATPLVWTQIADAEQSLVAPVAQRSTLWWARAPAVPTNMTVSVVNANAANIVSSVYELDNARQDFANIGTGKSTTGDPAAILGTPPVTDSLLFALAGCALADTGTVPPPIFLDTPAGFTSLYNITRANGATTNPIAAQSVVRSPANVDNVGWVSTGVIATALLLELKRV